MRHSFVKVEYRFVNTDISYPAMVVKKMFGIKLFHALTFAKIVIYSGPEICRRGRALGSFLWCEFPKFQSYGNTPKC